VLPATNYLATQAADRVIGPPFWFFVFDFRAAERDAAALAHCCGSAHFEPVFLLWLPLAIQTRQLPHSGYMIIFLMFSFP
jgi:hypothetical protein